MRGSSVPKIPDLADRNKDGVATVSAIEGRSPRFRPSFDHREAVGCPTIIQGTAPRRLLRGDTSRTFEQHSP